MTDLAGKAASPTASLSAGGTQEARLTTSWWVGYLVLIFAATLTVAVVASNAIAGFIAGCAVVLSATWTASRYRQHKGEAR